MVDFDLVVNPLKTPKCVSNGVDVGLYLVDSSGMCTTDTRMFGSEIAWTRKCLEAGGLTWSASSASETSSAIAGALLGLTLMLVVGTRATRRWIRLQITVVKIIFGAHCVPHDCLDLSVEDCLCLAVKILIIV